MNKQQRDERRRQEDIALSRGLIWVGAAIVLEFLLILVNKYYINPSVNQIDVAWAVLYVLKTLRVIALLGALVSLVWLMVRIRRRGGAGVLPPVLLIACVVLWLCSHLILVFYDTGVRLLFLGVPGLAALALVYYLYQREFFFSALVSGMAILGLWFVRHAGNSSLYAQVMAVCILLTLAFVLMLKKRGGVLGGRGPVILPGDTSYSLILLSCLVSLAALFMALALGTTLAYYLIYAMLAWMFALLVYYTVKLM